MRLNDLFREGRFNRRNAGHRDALQNDLAPLELDHPQAALIEQLVRAYRFQQNRGSRAGIAQTIERLIREPHHEREAA